MDWSAVSDCGISGSYSCFASIIVWSSCFVGFASIMVWWPCLVEFASIMVWWP